MNIKYLLFSALFLFSCSSKKNVDNTISSQELEGNSWQVIELLGSEVKDKVNDHVPYLMFDKEDNYSIVTGCNTLNGEFTLTNSTLKFGPGFSTMMFCEDMTVENGFKSILPKIDSYKFEGPTLYLLEKDKVVAKLKKYDVTDVDQLAGTSWTLDLLTQHEVTFNELFPNNKPTLIFEKENHITGNGSCNTFNSSYTLDGNKLTIGDILSSRMSCPTLEGEQIFFETLGKVNGFSLNNNVLELSIDDIIVMRFNKS